MVELVAQLVARLVEEIDLEEQIELGIVLGDQTFALGAGLRPAPSRGRRAGTPPRSIAPRVGTRRPLGAPRRLRWLVRSTRAVSAA